MFIFSAIEYLMIRSPEEFFDEFMIFLELALQDLKVQADQSVVENEPIFAQNLQRCYLRIPHIVLTYINDDTKIGAIIDMFVNCFSNAKLSLHQLCIIFTTLSMIAQGKSIDQNGKFLRVYQIIQICTIFLPS